MAAKKMTEAQRQRQAKIQKALETLRKVRQSKTVTLKKSCFMRDTFEDLEGNERPFKLRYYQVQGAYHLLLLKRMVLGDDTGLGKTVESIAAICHMMERDPSVKVLIVTPKSTLHQWASEIRRFTVGIRPIVVETPKKTKDGPTPLEYRKTLYEDWKNATDERVVLITNYSLLIRDWNAEGVRPVDDRGRPDPKQPVIPGVLDGVTKAVAEQGKLVTFLDEAQAFKSMRTKTWEIVNFLCQRSDRSPALTATLLKSNLMEGFSIYKAIKPELFSSKTKFLDIYCHTKLQPIKGQPGRKIPVVIGYKNIDQFREKIDPYFLGRKKQDVSDELPTLISKDIICEMSDAENRKYSEALSGILELGDGEIKDYEEDRALVALIYCQQVVDSLTMLKFKEGASVGETFDFEELDMKSVKVGALGAKETGLMDLLAVDGELDGEKVIVYTRFASLVPRLQKILSKQKIKSVCITGKQNDKQRRAAQQAFQDPNSDTRVIFITDAGGVGINLQMARALVFYDMPWTWGDYIQVLGRMIRIGSPHKGVMTYHLMAERPFDRGSRKTIDHHVYALLRKKKSLIDRVLGEAAVGALEFDKTGSGLKDLVNALREDSRAA